LWNQLAHDFEINVNKCGKYLIAVDEKEETELAALCTRGTKNGVLLQEVNEAQLVELRVSSLIKK
jgi:L-2-hydroxyglutarate oxidase LhgO